MAAFVAVLFGLLAGSPAMVGGNMIAVPSPSSVGKLSAWKSHAWAPGKPHFPRLVMDTARPPFRKSRMVRAGGASPSSPSWGSQPEGEDDWVVAAWDRFFSPQSLVQLSQPAPPTAEDARSLAEQDRHREVEVLGLLDDFQQAIECFWKAEELRADQRFGDYRGASLHCVPMSEGKLFRLLSSLLLHRKRWRLPAEDTSRELALILYYASCHDYLRGMDAFVTEFLLDQELRDIVLSLGSQFGRCAFRTRRDKTLPDRVRLARLAECDQLDAETITAVVGATRSWLYYFPQQEPRMIRTLQQVFWQVGADGLDLDLVAVMVAQACLTPTLVVEEPQQQPKLSMSAHRRALTVCQLYLDASVALIRDLEEEARHQDIATLYRNLQALGIRWIRVVPSTVGNVEPSRRRSTALWSLPTRTEHRSMQLPVQCWFFDEEETDAEDSGFPSPIPNSIYQLATKVNDMDTDAQAGA